MVAHEIAGLLYLIGLSIFFWPTNSPIFIIFLYRSLIYPEDGGSRSLENIGA
jgi:hypothetical protein